MIVGLDQTVDGLLDVLHLDQGHFRVLEKFELLDRAVLFENTLNIIFSFTFRDVAKVQNVAGLVDVEVVLRAGLAVAVQGRVQVLFREVVGVGALFRHVDLLKLGQAQFKFFPVQLLVVEVLDGHLGLLRLLELDQGRVPLLVQDLDSLDVAVDAEEGEEVVGLGFVFVEVGGAEHGRGGAVVAAHVVGEVLHHVRRHAEVLLRHLLVVLEG